MTSVLCTLDQLLEEPDRLVVLLAERSASPPLVGLLLVEQRLRRERPARDAIDRPERPVERSLRQRSRLEAAANEGSCEADLNEQDLDRLPTLLEVDRHAGQFAVGREPALGQSGVDRISVAAPGDEIDVGVPRSNTAKQKVESPPTAEPELCSRTAERVDNLGQELELNVVRRAGFLSQVTQPT